MIEVIQWLNDLPTLLGALVVIGGALVISYAGIFLGHALFSDIALRRNNIIGGFQYTFAGHVFAVFIGFLLFGVYERYDQVRLEVLAEANALTNLDQIATVFTPATRELLQTEVRAYAQLVADVEWPQMRRRVAGPASAAMLDDLYYTFQTIEPVSPKQEEVAEYALEQLAEVRHSRGIRLLRSLGSMQILLWAVATLGTVVAIAYPWLFGNPNVAAKVAMATGVTVIMMTVNFIILKLSYPFDGTYGILPEPYLAFLRSVGGFP